MVRVDYSVTQRRISVDIILEAWENYANDDEIKMQNAQTDIIFLKDIQENILDRFFSENKFILSRLPEQGIETGYTEDEYSLGSIIYEHRAHLINPEYMQRVEEAYNDGCLTENIEPLYLCYQLKYDVSMTPKGSI